jgi:apolipoprotein N-acyltransferase
VISPRSVPAVGDAVPAAVTSTRLAWRALLPPVASGMLIAAPFLDFALFPLAWIAFVPLLWSLAGARTAPQAAWLGLAAGLATNVPAFHWLTYTIRVFGGFSYPVALFFYACLSVYSACQFVLFALGVRRIGFGPLGLAVPLLWVGLEFLYPNLFPWRLANSQFHAPVLIQIGDVTGPFGLSFVMLWVGAGIVLSLRRPRRLRPLVLAGAAAAGVVVYGAWRMPIVQQAIAAAPPVRVGLIQGNIGIVEKGEVALFEVNVERYRELSRGLQEAVDVVVWPESVEQEWVPAAAELLAGDHHPFPGLRTHLLYGGLAFAFDGAGKTLKYNSAFLIDPRGRVLGRYDKQLLLPFGEFLPGASWFPQLAVLSPQTGDFTAGDRLVTLEVPGRVRVAPLICYEDVPSGIARMMTLVGAEALLTMFNDAWFGPTVAPYQHEALALWRAIENRRYFIRVGNAGVTGVVDPLGRVVARLGLFTEEVLVAEIRPLRLTTIYTRVGDLFAWLAVLATGVLLVRPTRQ